MLRSIPTADHRVRPTGGLVASLMLAFGSTLAMPADASECRASVQAEDGVDASIPPGDDFFRYANGAWLRTTEIPAGKSLWSARSEIAERTQRQVDQLLDEARSASAGSDARKAADFRTAYLNEAAIEARGLVPLQPVLDRIDGIRDKAALTRFLGSELRADVSPMDRGIYSSSHVLGFAVEAGIHGEKDPVAYLVQGGLGLADREQYLGADASLRALRTKRQAHIAGILARLGQSDATHEAPADRRAEAVMAFETTLARSHVGPVASADEHRGDTVWPRAEFARAAPGMDWTSFFEAAGLARQKTFVLWQPDAVKAVASLVASQPLALWKDYLRVRTVERYRDVLAPTLFAPEESLPNGDASAMPAPGWRAQRALAATQSAMSDAIGKMYVARHFPPEHKARVQAIAAAVVAALSRRVEAATWMTPASRTIALAKLRNVYFGVGYPDRWPDDSALVIDATDAVGNLQRIERRDRERAIARLGRPVDRSAWTIAAQWSGAVLTFNENAYQFAGALLQAPKFDASASDAINYGAIGAIVGHEVSHLVDTLGAEYGVDGRLRRWWTPDDIAHYDAVAAPLVRQFSAYRPFADVAVDGKASQTENVADLGGLNAAFDAYRASLGAKAGDKEYLCRQDRQFFIGFARSWRVKARDDALKAQAASDHAPEPYRISNVRNLDAWYDAFDVKPGQRLYLEPAARVRIW